MSDVEDLEEAGQDLIGSVLDGRYKVLSTLGRGGMGSVYLAEDQRFAGRKVVVKVPHPELLASPGFRKRFGRELESLIQLEHPHIVKVLDSGTVNGLPFAILQYLAGGSLEDRIRELTRSMPLTEVLAWMVPVAETLDFMHREGWMHRDIKPANILFDRHRHVFLADFGIAKAMDGGGMQLTQTGRIPGSPLFMAPEVLSGKPVGPAYDQYSLGVVLYFVLSGKMPHMGETPLHLMTQKITTPPQELQSLAPYLPTRATAAIMRSIAKSPEDRFPTCLDFARELELGLKEQAATRNLDNLLAWNAGAMDPSEAATLQASKDLTFDTSDEVTLQTSGALTLDGPATGPAAADTRTRTAADLQSSSAQTLPPQSLAPGFAQTLPPAPLTSLHLGDQRTTASLSPSDSGPPDGFPTAPLPPGPPTAPAPPGPPPVLQPPAPPASGRRVQAALVAVLLLGIGLGAASMGGLLQPKDPQPRPTARPASTPLAPVAGQPVAPAAVPPVAPAALPPDAPAAVQPAPPVAPQPPQPETSPSSATKLQQGCDAGDVHDCYGLATLIMEGREVPTDQARAAQLYRKGCEGGLSYACSSLGVLYEQGEGVPQDVAQAVALYHKACDQDDGGGCANLGSLYQEGHGVQKDFTQAVRLFRKSCDSDWPDGCGNLASLYKLGLGVPKNLNIAIDLFRQACEGGSDWSCQELKELEPPP